MKLKLSKRNGLLIGIAIFLLAAAGLFRTSSQKLDAQKKLDTQLTTLEGRLQVIQLEQLTSQRAQLEEQLKQVTPQFESAKALISQPISSTAAAAALFQAAKINRLIVTEMTSSSPTDERLEGANLQVLSLDAKVNGSMSDLADFVTVLNRSFVTGIVKSVTITVPEGLTSDNASASIEMVVYTYRGN